MTDTIGVVGGGLMGSGIVEVAARAGLDVVNIEVSTAASREAAARVESSLTRAVSRGKISAADAEAAFQRVRFTDDMTSLADRGLVIEAASENETMKLALFRKLGHILSREDAILASNTSSIPIAKLGAASGRPSLVMGVHFFNPCRSCSSSSSFPRCPRLPRPSHACIPS